MIDDVQELLILSIPPEKLGSAGTKEPIDCICIHLQPLVIAPHPCHFKFQQTLRKHSQGCMGVFRQESPTSLVVLSHLIDIKDVKSCNQLWVGMDETHHQVRF